MTGDPKNAIAQNAAIAPRVSYADYAHSMAHQQVAESIQALQTAVDAGVTGDAGKTINDLQAAFQAIDTEFASVKSDVAALNLVPGPKGDKGVKGNPGTSIGVTVGPNAPGSAKDGDFWIDGTEGFIYASGAWLKLNGAPGAQGPRGQDGNSVKTITASSVAWDQLPWVNWDRVSGALKLGIPAGEPGAPFTFRGLILKKNLLPDPSGKLGEAYSVHDGGAFTEMYVSDGTQWVLAAKLGNGADGGIGPAGPAGPDAFETWKKRTYQPSAGVSDWLKAIQGPPGPQGDRGKPGETLKVQGIVATEAQLPVSPPPLTVMAAQDTLTMWVFDPHSPAAKPSGWVDMGKVQGPPGRAAWVNEQVTTVSNLPLTGDEGEMRIDRASGHIWGWDEKGQRWVDGGLLIRAKVANLEDVADTGAGEKAILWFDSASAQWVPVAEQTWKDGLATEHWVRTNLELLTIGLAHEVPVLTVANNPPDHPEVGAHYLVSPTPLEDSPFDDHANDVAYYGISAGSALYEWHFSAPRVGETHLVEDQGANLTWNGTAWVKTSTADSSSSATRGVGEIIPWMADDIPDEYLECNGQVVPIGTYQDLYNKIGNKYNAGTGANGTTTFAVPDLRGYFLRGTGQNADLTTGQAVGSKQGDATKRPNTAFTGSTNNQGNHQHWIHVSSTGNFSGDVKYRDTGRAGVNIGNASVVTGAQPGMSAAGAHSHTVNVNGGGDAETRPKSIGVKWVIRARGIAGGAQGPQGVPGKGDLVPVGTVTQSLLTEAQFATASEDQVGKWVLADGRSVAGTKYEAVTGRSRVPDLRGAYMRMAGTNGSNGNWIGGNLNGWQEDSTARPKSAFTGSTNTTGNHNHGLAHGSNYVRTSGGGHDLQPGSSGAPEGASTFYTQGDHSHSVTINSGGDAETRPKTYSVNYFIKVN